MQYADDLTLFMRDGPSLEGALLKLDVFERFSGLKINFSKSFRLRVNTVSETWSKGSSIRFQNKISILGIPFYKDRTEEEQMADDFNSYINKMIKVCEV